MAVVVGDSGRGALVYRSVNGFDISEDEKAKANKLDIAISEALSALEGELENEKSNSSREKVETYWRFGVILNSLLLEADLIPAEQPYFFLNVKYRAPEQFQAKDRGPNRQHLVYCFRLGRYPRGIALLLKWSEWSYLFDSSGINSEIRFDVWFSNALAKDFSFFDRGNVRLLGRVLNSFFSKMETSDLSDEEIERCYEAARCFCASAQRANDKQLTKRALEHIKKDRRIVAQVLDNKIAPAEMFKVAVGF